MLLFMLYHPQNKLHYIGFEIEIRIKYLTEMI